MTRRQNSPPAGGVQLVQRVLNTRYGQRDRLHDEWPDRAGMEQWLREQGYIPTSAMVTEADFRRAVAMRESLRHLLRRSDGDSGEEEISMLAGLGTHLLLKVKVLSATETHLEPESDGVDGFLARLLAEVYTSMALGTWPRLKICGNRACSRAFYDVSKNHSGVWCSPRTCGNRMHARAYRQQKKRSPDLSIEA